MLWQPPLYDPEVSAPGQELCGDDAVGLHPEKRLCGFLQHIGIGTPVELFFGYNEKPPEWDGVGRHWDTPLVSRTCFPSVASADEV